MLFENNLYKTGYYANYRGNASGCHVVDFKTHKAICGYKPASSMMFQWCAYHVVEDYVRCRKCLDRLDKDRRERNKMLVI
jgi:hypothetical protein